jgi:hypothetical protein
VLVTIHGCRLLTGSTGLLQLITTKSYNAIITNYSTTAHAQSLSVMSSIVAAWLQSSLGTAMLWLLTMELLRVLCSHPSWMVAGLQLTLNRKVTAPQVITGSQLQLINLPRFILAIQPRHLPDKKHNFQQFFYCCVRICCRRHVFIEPLPSKGHFFQLHYSVFQVSCHNTDPNRVYRLLPNDNIFFGEFILQSYNPYFGIFYRYWYLCVTNVAHSEQSYDSYFQNCYPLQLCNTIY